LLFRQPIITIMGHIDSGKTTFLDKIKGTSIAKLEAGKITQHIGATEISLDVILNLCSHLLKKYNFEITLPGLLFIDTPGHNAFDNLRERGGSLADLVVLVVDINKGLQTQDIETLEILKMYKVPFIILANKIDLISGYFQEGKDISGSIDNQSKSTVDRIDEKTYKIVGQLYDKGFSADRFDRITDFKKQIAIIPASCEKEYGMPEAILFLSVLSQKFLGSRITIDSLQKAQGTILEVGEIKGIGKTVDAIIYQGVLKVKDKISFISRDGLIETKIKTLLKLNVMSAINKKRDYKSVDFVSAASGVKIVAPDLDKCLPGGLIVSSEDEIAILRLKEKPLSCFVSEDIEGAFVKTDTLGSLEALTKLLSKNNICIAKTDIGPITNKDILEIKILNQRDKKKGVLFLFNTDISKEFLDELNKEKIQVFKSNIIYKLVEEYDDWLLNLNKKEKDKLLKEIIFPCNLKVLKNHIFRTSKPAIVGVKVISGRLVPGSKILNKDKEIGHLESIQAEGKSIDILERGLEAAVSIKNAVYLRDLKEEDVLSVYVPDSSILKLEQILDDLTEEEQTMLYDIKSKRIKT
jgi:translation initiation factor 5B